MAAPLHILLADDDADDCFFFREVLEELPLPTTLSTVQDGASLMQYLAKTSKLPDVLFLDINMPRKGGQECLKEIKKDTRLKDIQVIMYSTSFNPTVIFALKDSGANFYIRKPGEFSMLKRVVHSVLNMIVEHKATSEEKHVVKLC